MYQLSDINRPISEYSNTELLLQKEGYRKPSFTAIIGMKQLLSDLNQEGIFVRLITNHEQSPCASVLPESVTFRTGRSITMNGIRPCGGNINVAWDFWNNDVIQHVIESEVI